MCATERKLVIYLTIGAVARVFRQFIGENDRLKVVGLGVLGRFIQAEQLARVADLPTKDQAIGLAMALMQWPIAQLARTLNEIPARVVRAVAATQAGKQTD